MSLEIGPGITLGAGVSITPDYQVATDGLVISLDTSGFISSPAPDAVWPDLATGPDFNLPNGATYSSANGGILTFNGTNQSAHGDSLGSALTTFTAETWAYFNSIPVIGGQATATITEVYATTPINFAIAGGVGGSEATLWQGGFFVPGPGWQVAGTLHPDLNTWYCLAVTFDGTNINFYVNGLINGTATTGVTPGSSGLGIHIGERWDAPEYPGTFLDGSVPIVRVYDRALSSIEVSNNFNAVKSRFGL